LNSIELKNVSKSFRLKHQGKESFFEFLTSGLNKASVEKLDVLKNVSFSVPKGETLGIIGPNGSGKTTLLRIIAGVYKPDKGNVHINGSLIPLLELGIGFQPDLTAIENIIMYGMILGFSKSDISKKINKILEFAELEKFRDVKINNFSSGMYGRLAFATAAQTEPDILLIDEILAIGDASFQEKCFDWIADFKKKGKSIVLVSHALEHITTFCDRAILLHQGNLISEGEPIEVMKTYKKLQGELK